MPFRHEIKHEINQRDPNKNVIYVTGETFGNELIKAINEKTNKRCCQE